MHFLYLIVNGSKAVGVVVNPSVLSRASLYGVSGFKGGGRPVASSMLLLNKQLILAKCRVVSMFVGRNVQFMRAVKFLSLYRSPSCKDLYQGRIFIYYTDYIPLGMK